ncbi:GNAT family N-acetyltransferase [Bacillus timonensis]|nr:GNAT family N-acetyltransferase [Bacillus timonensis]
MIGRSMLTGVKVKLTRIKESDIDTVVKWYEDVEFLRNLDAVAAFPKRANDFSDWIEKKVETNFTFAIRLIESDSIIGFINLDGILWNHRNTWLALAIGNQEHRGKGYAKEAMELAIDFAFYELNLHRIQLTVFDYNVTAISLYEKIGFTYEGTHREFIERDGVKYGMRLYGLLRDEWNRNEKREIPK